MQKAKIALVAAGVIKTAGRGRISAEGHAWLKTQHDAGVRFSDWPKGEVTVTKTEATAEKPAVSTVKVIRDASQSNEKVVAELTPYRYTKEEFKAVETKSGKERGMAEICKNGRGVSLVVCYTCETTHRIVKTDGTGDVDVIIKRK